SVVSCSPVLHHLTCLIVPPRRKVRKRISKENNNENLVSGHGEDHTDDFPDDPPKLTSHPYIRCEFWGCDVHASGKCHSDVPCTGTELVWKSDISGSAIRLWSQSDSGRRHPLLPAS